MIRDAVVLFHCCFAALGSTAVLSVLIHAATKWLLALTGLLLLNEPLFNSSLLVFLSGKNICMDQNKLPGQINFLLSIICSNIH